MQKCIWPRGTNQKTSKSVSRSTEAFFFFLCENDSLGCPDGQSGGATLAPFSIFFFKFKTIGINRDKKQF